jgi:hypothetical protein
MFSHKSKPHSCDEIEPLTVLLTTSGLHCLDTEVFPWYLQIHNMQTNKVKVKCTLVQALRLCTGRTSHRGSRGIALTFHDHSTRRG